jgi:Ca2+-transporting ATPase
MDGNPAQSELEAPWAKTAEEVCAALKVDPKHGLSAAEFDARRAKYGANELLEAPPRSKWSILLGQFAELMVGLLAGAAIVSAAVGEWHDAVLIGLIVVANAAIGYVQETKAEAAVAALRKLSQPQARALRDGKAATVPATELVPGDVIDVVQGDLAPADARLIDVAQLQVNESALTGESLPVDKTSQPSAPDAVLPDRTSMLHAGSPVAAGHARAVVVATGMATQIGRIAKMLQETQVGRTPLQERLAALSKRLALAVLAVCAVMFVTGYLRSGGRDWQGLLLTAVSLAVAAIPEGLPAVITIALALGSQRMARRNAIVRQLMAVETLGSVDVICSDKTGTLTQSQMTVRDIVPVDDAPPVREQLLKSAALCNNAELGEDGKLVGSATEAALLAAAMEHNQDVKRLRNEWPRISEIPFDSKRKRMGTVHRSPDGRHVLYVKGATEAVLPAVTQVATGNGAAPLSPADRDRFDADAEALAQRGRRVLSFAMRALNDAEATSPDGEALEKDLVLLGSCGLVDPIRPEASAAVAECESAGIRVVMITGDHPGTAKAVAGELNILKPDDKVVTGQELGPMTDEQLREAAPRISVYARVAPEHKLRIVKAHQARGSVVAMTGDGVNDAPALRQADIGVAMGIAGTEVSKQAAKIVLADDNFATIVAAAKEGRVVYDNIVRFVRYLLTANMGEVLLLFVAMLLGWPLPLLPVHLLWINLVTDGLPALALGFEQPEPNVMRRPPRKRDDSLFARGVARSIFGTGSLMAIVCLGLFWWHLPSADVSSDRAALAYPRTIVFWALAMFQLFYVLALRSSERSFFALGLWSNYRLIVAVIVGAILQAAVVYVPLLQTYFRTTALSITDLAACTALSTAAFWAAEIWKWLSSWHNRSERAQPS